MNVEVVNATAEVTVLGPASVVVQQANTEVEVAVGGAQGPQGPKGDTGDTGPQGPSGVIAVTAPITNSGTSTSANIGVTVGTTSTSVASGDRGLPTGGSADQILAKTTATDYAVGWIGQTAGSPLVAEWWTTPHAQTNFAIFTNDGEARTFGFRTTGIQANPSSASITYKFALSAGTYQVELIYVTGNNRADMTVTLGGASLSVLAGYSVSVVRNVTSVISNVSVTSAGLYDLVITNPTKNASSTGFAMFLQAATIRRTA